MLSLIPFRQIFENFYLHLLFFLGASPVDSATYRGGAHGDGVDLFRGFPGGHRSVSVHPDLRLHPRHRRRLAKSTSQVSTLNVLACNPPGWVANMQMQGLDKDGWGVFAEKALLGFKI